jgi:hypothetical protein
MSDYAEYLEKRIIELEALLSAAPKPADRVGQEPVAYLLISEPEQTTQGWEHGELDIEFEDAVIEKLAHLGGGSYPLYTAPQPSPDVAHLVQALENVLKVTRGSSGRIILDQQDEQDLREALAAHRQQEQQS